MSKTALFQLGMDHKHGSRDHGAVETQTEDLVHHAHAAGSAKVISLFAEDRQDHFIERDGVRFAGTHLIVDLMEAEGIDDLALMERTMRECVEVAGATLLHIHLHHFTPNDGISGVAVLAESHISVHTWPEVGYAAFDVFMCGDASPRKAVEVLKKNFKPRRVAVSEHMRGSAV